MCRAGDYRESSLLRRSARRRSPQEAAPEPSPGGQASHGKGVLDRRNKWPQVQRLERAGQGLKNARIPEQSEEGGEDEMRMKMQNGEAAGEALLGPVGRKNELGFQQTLGNVTAFKVT